MSEKMVITSESGKTFSIPMDDKTWEFTAKVISEISNPSTRDTTEINQEYENHLVKFLEGKNPEKLFVRVTNESYDYEVTFKSMLDKISHHKAVQKALSNIRAKNAELLNSIEQATNIFTAPKRGRSTSTKEVPSLEF